MPTKPKPQILYLTLKGEYFGQIVAGTKKTEYRSQSAHWKSRLEGKTYDQVRFRNGYETDSPEMFVEFLGVRRYGKGRDAYYAIRLGKVLKVKGWKKGR